MYDEYFYDVKNVAETKGWYEENPRPNGDRLAEETLAS